MTLKEAMAMMDGICFTLCRLSGAGLITLPERDIQATTQEMFERYCEYKNITEIAE